MDSVANLAPSRYSWSMTFIFLIFTSLTLDPPPSAQALEFQYRNGSCVNTQGMKGHNAEYLGECGQVEGMQLPFQTFPPGARFMGALMRRADLGRMNAESGNFTFADLTEATLDGAELRGCTFDFARLDAASFDFKSTLESCTFNHASAEAASFRSTNLRRVKMSGARLRGSSFRDADFYFADLTFADLRNTDLRGADLSFADLFGTQLTGSFYDGFTRLPFDRNEANRHGMIYTP